MACFMSLMIEMFGSTCPTFPADVNNDIAPTMSHLATPIAVIPFKTMKKINLILRKCKSLSRQLGRSSSYSSLRSKSAGEDLWGDHKHEDENHETIFVGSTRKRYVISSKYLSHPLVNALIEKSKQKPGEDNILVVKCEVVFFDHLLWMLENADPNANFDSLEELADLYMF